MCSGGVLIALYYTGVIIFWGDSAGGWFGSNSCNIILFFCSTTLVLTLNLILTRRDIINAISFFFSFFNVFCGNPSIWAAVYQDSDGDPGGSSCFVTSWKLRQANISQPAVRCRSWPCLLGQQVIELTLTAILYKVGSRR